VFLFPESELLKEEYKTNPLTKMKTIFKIVLCFCLLHCSRGSRLILESSPADIKDGLTSKLSLRCSLNDTAASSAIVGRRDVSQTTENMAAVSSVILMLDGSDVASISPVNPAHLMDVSRDVSVSGSVVSDVSGEVGYLEVIYTDPSKNQSGEWSCEVNAISASGHVVTFRNTAEVTVSTPSTADVLAAIRQINREKEVLEHKEEVLEQTIAVLHKNGAHPNIFFSVGLSKSLNAQSDQVIIYDKIFANVGDSFDNSTSIFTCKAGGYYRFVITALNAFQERHYITLQKNGANVIAVYARKGAGNGEQGSNTVIVGLVPGDVVRVMAHVNSHLYNSDPEEIYTTFTGEMIAVV